jgi:ferredoxin
MRHTVCDKKPGVHFDVSCLLAGEGDAVGGEVCVVDRAAAILREARRASCGKCVFCREGTIQLDEILRDGTSGKAEPDDLELLAELAGQVRDNAGCEMASAAAAALAGLMERYPGEFEQHFKRGRCSALLCKAYYTVHVLPDKCTGCGACLRECPEGAIAGGEGLIHVIDQGKCTRCGACIDICRPVAQAIAKAGAVKPRTPEAPAPVGGWGDEGGGRRRRRRGQDNTEGSVDE